MRVVEDLIQPVVVISVRPDMFSELIFMVLPRTAVESSLQLFAKPGRDRIVGGRNVKVRPVLIRLGTGGREAVRGTFFVAVPIVGSVSAAAVAAAAAAAAALLRRMRIRSRWTIPDRPIARACSPLPRIFHRTVSSPWMSGIRMSSRASAGGGSRPIRFPITLGLPALFDVTVSLPIPPFDLTVGLPIPFEISVGGPVLFEAARRRGGVKDGGGGSGRRLRYRTKGRSAIRTNG